MVCQSVCQVAVMVCQLSAKSLGSSMDDPLTMRPVLQVTTQLSTKQELETDDPAVKFSSLVVVVVATGSFTRLESLA